MNMWIYLTILLVQIAKLGVVGFDTHVVNTTLGDVLGTVQDVMVYGDGDNGTITKYVQYLGIPYAVPPVGELRFKKPVPVARWTETHNGTFYRPVCCRGRGRPNDPQMVDNDESEDCLTLDIYAPVGSTSGDDIYPVIVFMHGMSGGSRGYIGDVLCASGDVIVVVINFRIGLMGFFSTGDASAPGNYGLWDQHLAIKWINDHIQTFKGDPERITLVGHSMGASNAIFQAMYAGNHGMIQRVIAQSESPIPTYKASSYFQKPSVKVISQIAEALGCKQETSEKLISCMRSKSLSEIDKELSTLLLVLTPVIDGEFILDDPQSVLSGQDPAFQGARDMFASVDLVTGLVNMEGGTHIPLLWAPQLGQTRDTFDINRTSFESVVVPITLDLVYGKNISDAVLQTAIFQYSDLKDPENQNKIRDMVVQLSTDIDFAVPATKTATIHSRMNGRATYFYQFSANLSISNPLTPSWLTGANHDDDIWFLFGFSQRMLDAWKHLEGFVPTQEERGTARRLEKLWTNFVKTGNPNNPDTMAPGSEWQPFNHITTPYLEITHNSVSSHQYFREPYMTFWIKIFTGLIDSVREDGQLTKDGDKSDLSESFKTENLKFKIDNLTADNIILALIIICASLFFAFILVCSLSIVRGNIEKYTLKAV